MKTSNSFLDRVLPTFGNERENIPVYDSTQKMFLSNTYTSQSGNMYYKGIRFSERIVMVEHVGLYKNWTYIDEIEIFSFNGTNREIIGKKKFEKQFYNASEIKDEASKLVFEYLKSQMQISGANTTDENIQSMAIEVISETYDNPIEKIKRLPEATRLMLN